MKEEKRIVLDLGNGMCKYRNVLTGKAKTFISSTLVGAKFYDESMNIQIVMHENGVDIEYTIGSADGKPIKNRRRYMLDEYRALVMAGIAKSIEGSTDTTFNVKLGLNLPIEMCKNSKYAEMINDNIQGKHQFTYKDKYYDINVTEIYILPENLIVSTLSNEEVRHKNLFIDIGSGTLDLLFTEGMQMGNMKTEYTGIKDLIADIASKAQCSERQVENYWEDLSDVVIKKEHKDLTTIQYKAVTKYVDNIISMAEKVNGGSLNDVDCVYVLGGGAEKVGKQLVDMFIDNKVVIVKNPTFANLECMETLMEAQIQQKEASKRGRKKKAE